MTTLATIRQAMTAFLAEAGIEALSAWPKEVWKGRKTPVAVVQVKEVEAGVSGFQNYLGQTYDPAARQWTERYGRRITVKFGVTLYSPEAAGESGCQALLEQVAQALMERGPAGFAVEKWSAGAHIHRSGKRDAGPPAAAEPVPASPGVPFLFLSKIP